jgi:serine protease Do
MPCVVSITNEYSSYDSWYGDVVDDEACGSGIIIEQNDQELMIVTNYHVIEDSKSLIISFIDDSEAEAYVKGVSSEDDLAIVSVSLSDLSDETINAIAIAALGDSDTLQVGEPAIAIGNSLGYGQSVTTGVISALNRNINESYLIQTDAAINPGNSGGALLNIKGEVIGINSSKIADYVIEGMGYAIPISTAKPIIDELMLNETKKKVDEGNRGFLGISGTDVTEDASSRYGMPQGVYVASVIDGGGAKNAGIAKGDIITTFDGVAVDSMTSLQAMLEYYEAGANVDVVIMRQSNGEYVESTVTVTLGKKQS